MSRGKYPRVLAGMGWDYERDAKDTPVCMGCQTELSDQHKGPCRECGDEDVIWLSEADMRFAEYEQNR